ncbi:MAG: hypothetical protein BroJett011_18710 [Chloroflexota bacterium]|nr:MAG: hypothetical protein BroJett011_18710 [Chloroflexota bacterium]
MSKLLSLFNRRGSQSSTDAIRQSTSMTMAYLLEQNRKFEFFMRQKVEELEGRVSAQQQTRQDLEYGDEADYDYEIDRVEEADQDQGEPTVPAPITSADVDEPFGSAVAPLSSMSTTRPMDGGTDADATRKTVVVSGQPGFSPGPLSLTPEDLTETGLPSAEDGQSKTSTDAPLPEESLTGDELPENELEVSPSPTPEPDIPAEDLWLVMLGGEAEAPVASPRQPTSLVISEWNAFAEAEGNEAEPADIEDNRSEVETRPSELAEPETEDESAESDPGEEGSTAAEAIAESAEVEATKAEMTEPEPEDEPSEEEFREAWPTAEIAAEPEANDAKMTEPETGDETENERVTDPAKKSMPTVGVSSQIKMSDTQAEEEDSDSLLPSWVTAQLKN